MKLKTYQYEVKEYFLKEQANSGLTIEKFCKKFDLKIRSFFNWKKKYDEYKTLKTDSLLKKRPKKLTQSMLKNDIEKYPDSFYYERAQRLNCSKNAIFLAVHKFGFTHKKKLS